MPATTSLCRAVLAVAALLLCATALTPRSYVASASVSMECALSGSTYYWQTLLNYASGTSVQTSLNNAIQTDLQNVAGSTVTVTLGSPFANASALIVPYTYTVNTGYTTTAAEVAANVQGQSFPNTQSELNTIQSNGAGTPWADLSDITPTNVHSIVALYYNPDDSSSGTSLSITGNVTYGVDMLLTGTPATWTQVMKSDSANIESKLTETVNTLTSSRRIVCDATVISTSVVAADPSFKSIGDGSGGLYVILSSNCGATSAMTGRFLFNDEYASVLLTADMTSVTAEYQSASGSSETIAMETTVAALTSSSAFVCDTVCKGMIGMGIAIAALSVICVVVTLIAICCPFCCLRVQRQKSESGSGTGAASSSFAAQAPATKKARVVECGFEVRSPEQVQLEPHTPTTVPRNAKRSSEPVE